MTLTLRSLHAIFKGALKAWRAVLLKAIKRDGFLDIAPDGKASMQHVREISRLGPLTYASKSVEHGCMALCRRLVIRCSVNRRALRVNGRAIDAAR